MSTDFKYPYRYGADVVNEFVEKYARGANYLSDLLGISPGELRHYLTICFCRGVSFKWERIKALIKMNEYESRQSLKKYTDSQKIQLYKRLLWVAEDEVLQKKLDFGA